MMATKSSSAKVVPKINKEEKSPAKTVTKSKGKGRQVSQPSKPVPFPEIPVMGRSGTFLKDEPMFGDKTTDIDVAQ